MGSSGTIVRMRLDSRPARAERVIAHRGDEELLLLDPEDGSYYALEKKHALLPTAATNPFIDPEGYHHYVTEREQAFRAEWEKQKAK